MGSKGGVKGTEGKGPQIHSRLFEAQAPNIFKAFEGMAVKGSKGSEGR